MKHRIHTDSLNREFRLLRNRIEAEIHSPAVILVTSATQRDGASLTAYGLAESMSKTHQRTALITTAAPLEQRPPVNGEQPVLRRRASDRLAGDDSAAGGLKIVSISHERLTTISRANVASLIADLRAEHDFVVIDGGDLPNNSFALLLVALTDAVLVTFLSGRQQTPQDRIMLDTLERSETKMLGIVMTDQASLDQFALSADGASDTQQQVAVKKSSPNPFHRLEVALQRIGKPS
jgi:Mrp family chromosome partitioning ATPase